MEGNCSVRRTQHLLYGHVRTHLFAGFVAETTTFITECAEDDNDIVVKESHRLKNAVESVAGKISGL